MWKVLGIIALILGILTVPIYIFFAIHECKRHGQLTGMEDENGNTETH